MWMIIKVDDSGNMNEETIWSIKIPAVTNAKKFGGVVPCKLPSRFKNICQNWFAENFILELWKIR